MRPPEDCIIISKDREQANDSQDSITDSNHGSSCIQENYRESDGEGYEAVGRNDTKTISTRKWQIVLTSEDCTIKKHCLGWQVRSTVRFNRQESKTIL